MMMLPLKSGYNFNLEHCYRPPHFELAAESYTDFYGFSYMLNGECQVYSPDFTIVVRQGEMLFASKQIYRCTTYMSDAPCENILVKFTDTMISDILKLIGVSNFNKLCEEAPMHFEKNTQNKICSIIRKMEREWNTYNEYSELLLKSMLNELIIICLRERIIGGMYAMRLDEKHACLTDAINYIKAHLHESPSLEETARHVNISASHLSKIFSRCLHTPFSVFILNEKITYAQRLLVNTGLNMTEIASESGFSSGAYFSDCFRRMTGLSPLQYRKQNGLQKK